MDKCFNFSLKEGSSMLVCGPTMSGKSTFVHALLSDRRIFNKRPKRVYWFHGQETEELKSKEGCVIKEGLPESFDYIPPTSVIILNDSMAEAKDHVGVIKLFTK